MTAIEVWDFARLEPESIADLAEMVEHLFADEEKELETTCRNILDAINQKHFLKMGTVH